MYVQSYKDLIVWQKSVALVKEIYFITRLLPKEELYVLSSQIRRAAISIPSNIAEGKKRRSKKEFISFLRISDASAAELETQIIIAKELYPAIDCSKSEELLNEVQKILITIIKKLEIN